MKTFKSICKMSQTVLKLYVKNQLTTTHKDIVSGDGYVYAQGQLPILLVAHMDTVHKALPSIIHYNKKNQSLSSPSGIGGDDRCGVWMILEAIKKYNCSVLFCEDEEIGCVGANKFIETPLATSLEFNYIIEFDRRGDRDAVFYDCANDEFEAFVTKDYYQTAYGSFSDISYLAPFFGCAAVNLSCGYYNAHTTQEYVVIPEMRKSLEEACKIIERTTENDKFEYIESKYGKYSYLDYGWWYDSYEDTDAEGFYYMIEYVDREGNEMWDDCWALSKYEAIGKFLEKHSRLTYLDIIYVYKDEPEN